MYTVPSEMYVAIEFEPALPLITPSTPFTDDHTVPVFVTIFAGAASAVPFTPF